MESQEKWEAQLSSIIERTNANLTLLQRSRRQGVNTSNDSRAMHEHIPVQRVRKTVEKEERKIDEDALYARLVARWEEDHQGDRLVEVEERVNEIQTRSQQAIATARSQEAAVEALAKELQIRRGALAKASAWQAETEEWRLLVDKKLAASNRSKGQYDIDIAAAIERQGTLLWRSAPSDIIAALEARAASIVHATMVPLAKSILHDDTGPSHQEHDVLERRLEAKLESKLLARQSEAFGSLRTEVLQKAVYASSGHQKGIPGSQQSSIDRTATKILEAIESNKEELYSFRMKVEGLEKEFQVQKSLQERALEEAVLEVSAQSRTALTAATNAQERTLDAVATARKRAETLSVEALEALEARHSEWQTEASDLRRISRRHDIQLERLREAIKVAKLSARAYAEDAPGVKKAAVLSTKFEKVQTKCAQIDDRLASIQAVSDHSQQSYGLRFQEIEDSISNGFERHQKESIQTHNETKTKLQTLSGRLDKFENVLADAMTIQKQRPPNTQQHDQAIDNLKGAITKLHQRYDEVYTHFESALTEMKTNLSAQVESFETKIADLEAIARRALDTTIDQSHTTSNGDRSIDGARLLALEDAVHSLNTSKHENTRLHALELEVKRSAKMHNELAESIHVLRRRLETHNADTNTRERALESAAAIAAQRVGVTTSPTQNGKKSFLLPPTKTHDPVRTEPPPRENQKIPTVQSHDHEQTESVKHDLPPREKKIPIVQSHDHKQTESVQHDLPPREKNIATPPKTLLPQQPEPIVKTEERFAPETKAAVKSSSHHSDVAAPQSIEVKKPRTTTTTALLVNQYLQEAFQDIDSDVDENDKDNKSEAHDDHHQTESHPITTTHGTDEAYEDPDNEFNDDEEEDDDEDDDEDDEEDDEDEDDDGESDLNDSDDDLTPSTKRTGVSDYLSRFRRRISSQGSLTPRASSVQFSSSDDDDDD